MRIAQIAPLAESVPPKLYGGTERVVSYLTEELVRMGHDVTLFASGDSRTAAHLHAMWPQALRLDPGMRDPITPHLLMIEEARRMASSFDILHFHIDHWSFSVFSRQATPFLTTLHGRLDLPELQPIYDLFPKVPVVSISDSQRTPLPQANFVATVHHGLPENLLTPTGATPRYLAFLGRICPEKGIEAAIAIAEACGIQLRIAAKVDKADQEYYEKSVKPLLGGPNTEFIGEISEGQKAEFLSNAIALLMPIDWPEPFGLVMIEAMACGTPVVAFNHGSVPEIIEDGVSGFVVENVAEARDAVAQAARLPRAGIRHAFERRFTARRMAEDYVALYQRYANVQPKLRLAAI